jgi:hypothetical protein
VSGGRFRDIDLDLLADYVGGALDGTSEADEIARLIADDPMWAQAYDALVTASAQVRDSLAAWGADEVTMPADVVDRLSEALSAVNGEREPDCSPGAPGVPSQPRKRSPAVADHPSRPPTRRSHRRRVARWAVPAGFTIAVAAFVGIGLSELGHDSGGEAPATDLQPEVVRSVGSQPPVGRIISSGSDYARADLPAALAAATGTTSQPGVFHAPSEEKGVPAVAGLEQLSDPAALSACLKAVAAAHGHDLAAVDLVDYAAFEGSPAVVIRFLDVDNDRWAWVVGPDCGRPDAGADTRYRLRVG